MNSRSWVLEMISTPPNRRRFRVGLSLSLESGHGSGHELIDIGYIFIQLSNIKIIRVATASRANPAKCQTWAV